MGGAAKDFCFGLEAEYLLVRSHQWEPLWFGDLTFFSLNSILESIPVADLPNPAGLDLNPPHRRVLYYGVEGYHVHGDGGAATDLLPKGVEIRTPKSPTPELCLYYLQTLFGRLQRALGDHGLSAVALSHHPTADLFEGPRGTRTPEYWLWAQQAMSTYGPDVNISLPESLRLAIDFEVLQRRVNYYTPALAAFTLASPFYRGKLWEKNGKVGKSIRTFRRSPVGLAFEIHPDQEWRLELKALEMTHRAEDFYNYLLLWLALLLDPELAGQSSLEDCRAELVDLGVAGWNETLRYRADELLTHAFKTLSRWGFAPDSLGSFAHRLDRQYTPADRLIHWWREEESLPPVLSRLTHLEPFSYD